MAASALSAVALLLAGLLTGCDDGGSGADDPSGGPAPVRDVAGEYDTTVALLDSSCSGLTVSDNPTTVDQEAGSSTIELTHAGITWTGDLAADGKFTTTVAEVQLGADTHALSIEGTFVPPGFRAIVHATVTSSGGAAPCEYDVSWVGTVQ